MKKSSPGSRSLPAAEKQEMQRQGQAVMASSTPPRRPEYPLLGGRSVRPEKIQTTQQPSPAASGVIGVIGSSEDTHSLTSPDPNQPLTELTEKQQLPSPQMTTTKSTNAAAATSHQPTGKASALFPTTNIPTTPTTSTTVTLQGQAKLDRIATYSRTPALVTSTNNTASGDCAYCSEDENSTTLYRTPTRPTCQDRYGPSLDPKMLANYLEKNGDFQDLYDWIRGSIEVDDIDALFQDLCFYLEMPLSKLLKANKHHTISIGFNLWRDIFGAVIWKCFQMLQPIFETSILAVDPGQMLPVLADNFVFLRSDGDNCHSLITSESSECASYQDGNNYQQSMAACAKGNYDKDASNNGNILVSRRSVHSEVNAIAAAEPRQQPLETTFRALAVSPTSTRPNDTPSGNNVPPPCINAAPDAVLSIPDVFLLVGSFLGFKDTAQLACTCTSVNSAFYTKEDLVFSHDYKTRLANWEALGRPLGLDDFDETYDERRLASLVLKHRVVRRLRLANFEYKITDSVLQTIAQHSHQLTHLDLEDCHTVREAGFLAIATHCRQLTHLTLTYTSICNELAPCLTNVDLENIALGCQQLTYLHVMFDYNVDGFLDRGIEAVAKHCQQLTHLYLEEMEVSHKSLKAIIVQCQRLTHLHLDYSSNQSIRAVARGCPALKHLVLKRANITNKGLRAIVAHSQQLTHLALDFCFRVSNRGIAAVAPKLQFLSIAYCSKVTDGVLDIAAHCLQKRTLHQHGRGCFRDNFDGTGYRFDTNGEEEEDGDLCFCPRSTFETSA